jgi:serine/threonine protein kinase/Flp pilus assembly protein TadD
MEVPDRSRAPEVVPANTSTVSDASLTNLPVTAPAAVGSPLFAPGQLVSERFRVVRCIARGGMGVVYEVLDEKLGERRALKCALPGHVSRLSPEARHALRVTHPNVCRTFEIHSMDTAEGAVDFITMEYLDGDTLADRLEKEGALPLTAAREIAQQICAGVEAAHAQGVLHRDLKSSNVMLTTDARGQPRAVVTDFGLSRERHATEHAARNAASGTLHYLAPERQKGAPATVASDVFALGIVLHELITGRRPPVTSDGQRVLAPGLPRPWRAVIARCLNHDPEARYTTADAVSRALTDRAGRSRTIAWASAVLLAAALAVGRVFLPTGPATQLAILPLDAVDADPHTQLIVHGVSSDLSARLRRHPSRPSQLVIIPVDDARRVSSSELDVVRQSLGASHVLRGSVARRENRLLVRGEVVDTRSKVTLRDFNAEYALGEAYGMVEGLSATVAAAFAFPRAGSAETIAPEAYVLYAEGQGYLQPGQADYSRAIDAFERAITLDGSSLLPRAALAEACYRAWESTGEARWLARGRAELARAAALDADAMVVRLAAGRIHLVPGTFDRAAQEYRRAVDLDATNPDAWTGLARAYEGLGDRDVDAAAAYSKAIELQPGYYVPLANFGEFYRARGNSVEAEKYLLQVVALVPQLLLAHSNLGALYSDMGRYEEAQRELTVALEIAPASRAVLNNLATVHQYQGQDREAVVLLERARAVGPDTYALFTNLGDSYRRLNRVAESETAYTRARELADELTLRNPRDAAARAFVAYLSARLGDRATAERELTQALNFGGSIRAVIRRAAITYEALDDLERALAMLDSAPADVIRELSRHPDTRRLRADPRFTQLLSRARP